MAPSGDMRRVVVAAEGAKRFLGMDKVSAQELGPLFDFLQWPRPKDFVQTLRNAGAGLRSSGWRGRRGIRATTPSRTRDGGR